MNEQKPDQSAGHQTIAQLLQQDRTHVAQSRGRFDHSRCQSWRDDQQRHMRRHRIDVGAVTKGADWVFPEHLSVVSK